MLLCASEIYPPPHWAPVLTIDPIFKPSPNVNVRGRCIGGSDDLHRLAREGGLRDLLTDAGIQYMDPESE
jgi:hypothetical protein